MKGWIDTLGKQKVIKDNRGQWDYPGEITEISSNNITMRGVPYPVLGISNTGDTKIMKPGGNYKFKGQKVTEYPMAQSGMQLSSNQWGDMITPALDLVPKELKTGPKKDKRKSSDIIKVKSSLNEGEINYVRTTKKNDKTVSPKLPIEKEATKEFIDWYSDPVTKEKFTKNTGMDSERLQDFVGRSLRTPMRAATSDEDIGYLRQQGADAQYTSPFYQKATGRESNKETGEILYFPQTESTSYYKAPNMKNVLQHELAHAAKLDAVLGPALQRTLGDVNKQTKGTFKRDREYLSHPEEAYGNFHMFRKNLGLKPGQKVNQKQLQDLVKKKGLDEEIFYKAYDDDKIVKAINTIAFNKSDNKQTNMGYAKNGKKIINFGAQSLALIGK